MREKDIWIADLTHADQGMSAYTFPYIFINLVSASIRKI